MFKRIYNLFRDYIDYLEYKYFWNGYMERNYNFQEYLQEQEQSLLRHEELLRQYSDEELDLNINYLRELKRVEFRQSKLKEELMAIVWHPKNFEKFKYLDPEIFEDF